MGLMEIRRRMLADNASHEIPEWVSEGPDDVVSFESDWAVPMRSLKVAIDPVQDLSQGDPSPDNVCPIEGWTGAQVTRTGKNLLDTTNAVNGKINADGSVDANPADPRKVTKMLSVKPNTAYYFWNVVSASEGRSGYWYDSSGNGIGLIVVGGVNASSGTVTSPSNAAYCRVNYFATNENICMMSLGTAQPTSYEPYTGNTYSISWETEAGTVYGGTLDVVTGELVVNRASVDLGTLTWNYRANFAFFTSKIADAKYYNRINGGNCICSMYASAYNATISGWSGFPDKTVACGNNYSTSDGINVTLKDTTYTNAVTVKAAMSGVQLVYELAEPQTYHLTSTEVRTLLGQNNVWADTGDVEVQYWVRE